MLNRLKNNYGHALGNELNKIPLAFRLTISNPLDEKEVITFDKRELSNDEIMLLETLFFEKADMILEPKTPTEKKLFNYLTGNGHEDDEEGIKNTISFPCRFIHFTIQGSLADRTDFEDAMKNLFISSHDLLWLTPKSGFFVQAIDEFFEEDIPIESIVDTIVSDFYVQLSVFIGSPIASFEELKERFTWENEVFEITRQSIPSKKIFFEQEIIPYLLFKDLQDTTKKKLLSLLAPVVDDKTLLESVKLYLECNLNVSLAAKKLFMHRNTLQYRVDKFIEKTSIDIKRFPNAVAVYFMLTLLQHTKRED